MTRFLIYLFPAVADIVVASALFVCGNRLADAGLSKTIVATIFSTWAVVYIITNQLLAHVVTSRNAARWLIAANIMFVVTAGAFVLFPQIWMMFIVMGFLAVATAAFFMPFQVFMKSVEPDQHQGVVRSTALYTCSWSLGFACGPFIAGLLYQKMGWQWCHAFNAVLGLLTVVGICMLKHHAQHHHDEATSPHQAKEGVGEAINYHSFPDLAWLGWVAGGVGCLVIYMINGLMPSLGVDFHMPKSQVGLIVTVVYMTQGLMGLSFIRSKTWMYRALPVLGFAGLSLISMTVFYISLLPFWDAKFLFDIPQRTLLMCAAAVFYGLYSGSLFFSLVFHALVHPARSAKNVAINETLVGICGIVGPVLAGALADVFNNSAPFIVGGFLLIGIMIFQSAKLRALKIPQLQSGAKS